MSFKPQHAVVWSEINVIDLDKGRAFYEQVFDIEMQSMEMGGAPIAVFPTSDGKGVSVNLKQGKPAKEGGSVLHMAVEKLEPAVARLAAAGGQALSDVIPIPEGRLVYALDLDGNPISLFEWAA